MALNGNKLIETKESTVSVEGKMFGFKRQLNSSNHWL